MITADRLTKRFGSTLAVDEVSFEVAPGTLVSLVGHDGAGKTTTLRMLVGHVRPTAGNATILGQPYQRLEQPLRRIGVLVGDGIHPARRVRDHLRICAALGAVDGDRIGEVLRIAGLEDDAGRRARELPVGMRRRLGIASALLADPDVLILDEPGAGFGSVGMRWIADLLRRLADNGRTILVASVEADEVAQAADRVLVLDRGRLLTDAPPDDLTGSGSEVLVRSPGAEALADELRSAGIETTVVGSEQLRVRNAPATVVGQIASASGLPLWELREDAPGLDRVVSDLATNGEARRAGPAREGAEPAPQPGGDAEAAVDSELAALPPLDRARVVAVLAPVNGLGRTTLSFLVADVLARCAGMSTLAIALSCDHDRIGMGAAEDGRTSLDLGDLLGDLPDFDETAQLSPYVSVARSGAHVLSGLSRAERLAALEPAQIDALLDFAGRFHGLVVLDVGELADPSLRAVVRRADRVLLLGAPGEVGDIDERSSVLDAIEAERSDHATLVFNRVDEERMRTFAGPGTHVLIPQDHNLTRLLNHGDFELGDVSPVTRYALKRLGLAVAEGLR